jgi:hypothetical protein
LFGYQIIFLLLLIYIKTDVQPRLKCLFETDFLNDIKFDTNPDLFPALFLMINTKYAYIIGPNKQLKFVYESSNAEILDIFCLGEKRLIVVESGTSNIKIFPDYTVSNRFVEFKVTESEEVFYLPLK